MFHFGMGASQAGKGRFTPVASIGAGGLSRRHDRIRRQAVAAEPLP